MDTTITMRNSKAEMFAHIRQLELRNLDAARERVHLRERISVLEGAAALKRDAFTPTVQRFGQRTVKRWPSSDAPQRRSNDVPREISPIGRDDGIPF